MSTIENFKKEKDLHDSMVRHAYRAQNIKDAYNPSRDKFGLCITPSTWHDNGEVVGYLTGHSGYFGDSGCTYECDSRLRDYLFQVINLRMEELVEQAIGLSARDVEKKRLLAVVEAQSVLQEANNGDVEQADQRD